VTQIAVLAPPDFGPLSMLPQYSRDVTDADVIFVGPRSGPELREVWPQAKRVRWVHSLSAGVETILCPELRPSDVVLTNGRGVFAPALAEWAVAAILYFAKNFPRLLRAQRERAWESFNVERVEGQTVGIVGYGSIGRAVVERCVALGMRPVAFSRHQGSLEEVLREADYIVVSTPLTNDTRGMIGAAELKAMRRNAVLINVGRGPVVDEAAMITVLKTHRIKGAALDVFEHEPLPPDHPLWTLDNVLISPHGADYTSDSHERAMRCFLDNLARFERGEELMNVVDKNAGY
jgi:phosphoglycerate dehydrogenase-like enzyme